MKARFAVTCIAFHFAALIARGEWIELKNEAGRVVEIVADFKIEDMRIDASGTTSFIAKEMFGNEELGFSVALSKPSEGTIQVSGQDRTLPVMRTDFDIRSIGRATERLERRLCTELKVASGGDEPTRVAGLYSAYCPNIAASPADVAVVRGRSVGISYDKQGKRTAGDCFAIKFLIDGPLGRVTVYFHEEGGYGGTALANLARSEWYDLRIKEAGKKSEEHVRDSAAEYPQQP
jgi:hypothetical protein